MMFAIKNGLQNFIRVQEKPILWFVLGLFFILAAIYNVTVPLFEAPDEKSHFLFIHWVTQNRSLPHILEDGAQIGHEVAQPPLYYWLAAQAVGFIDLSDINQIAPANPHWQHLGDPHVWVHTEKEVFPYQKTTLAVHLTRLFSSLLALGTIYGAYALARLVNPSIALLTAAFIAFNPQFIAVSASINNDNLLILLCTWMLWFVVRITTELDTDAKKPFSPQLYRSTFCLGTLYGLAVITKLSGLAFGPIIALAIMWGVWQTKDLAIRIFAGTIIAGGGLLLTAGWWFWRNWQLYADPIAYRPLEIAHQAIARKQALSWGATVAETSEITRTFWYTLTNAQLQTVPVMYWLLNGLALIGLFLALKQVINTSTPKGATILLWGWSSIIIIFLFIWVRDMNNAAQGRLLFPALPAIAVLLINGFDQLKTKSVGIKLQVGLVLMLCGLAITAPWISIIPTFNPPRPWTAAIPSPTQISFNDEINLNGFEPLPKTIKPGEPVPVALFWEGIRPMTNSYIITMRLFDATGQEVSQKDFFPAQARYPTTVWEPHKPFQDLYELPPIRPDATPGTASLHIALHTWDNSANLLAVTQNQEVIGSGVYVAQTKIGQPHIQTEPPHSTETQFGSLATLLGYETPTRSRVGKPLPVVLYWQGEGTTDRHYTVFVHLVNQQGELVAQADAAPQQNLYPTQFWESGEQIIDTHIIDTSALQTGEYTLFVGFYDTETGERIQAIEKGVELSGSAQTIPITLVE